jgi:PPK2 family polyphosphate:nucleotide phosphotransferase
MSDGTDADGGQQLSAKQYRKLVKRFRVTSGHGFKLKDYATDDPVPDVVDKHHAAALLQQGVERLATMQELLYADSTWSLLIVFQAMDAAGKDSTIKHVMTGVNPQGVSVTSFKAPGPEDLAHDFLWRTVRALPARGMIGIFNRSHYEEVLVTRVHPEILQNQRLPPSLTDGKKFWEHRLEDIACFERHLTRQGTRVLKFFLNVGLDEQKKRFLARLDEPAKTWKFNASDIKERGYWDDYMKAYEEAIAATATEEAPWFVVPADQKWFTRLVVVAAINEALSELDLKPVHASADQTARLAEARRLLEDE